MTKERDPSRSDNHSETCQENVHPSAQDTPAPETVDTEDSFRDKWLRAMADAENTRRRFEKEKQDSIDYANSRFAKDMLSVMDALTLAVQSVTETDQQEHSLFQGVNLTLNALRQVFQQNHITEIEALGTIFNPHKHQVLQEIDNTDVDPGTVLTVIQPGYMIKDRLLRASMVVVSKRPA